jgi:large subunit ribosomal protein L15
VKLEFIMDLSTLTNVPGARKSRKRIGRGRASGHGKTSTHGHKGQQARKGHKHKLGFEGGQMPLIRRLPKRGFTNFTRVVYCPVNVCALERFEDGTEVTVELLKQNGLFSNKFDGVKILGCGDLTKKLVIKVNGVSAVAKTKIEAAGGSVELV